MNAVLPHARPSPTAHVFCPIQSRARELSPSLIFDRSNFITMFARMTAVPGAPGGRAGEGVPVSTSTPHSGQHQPIDSGLSLCHGPERLECRYYGLARPSFLWPNEHWHLSPRHMLD